MEYENGNRDMKKYKSKKYEEESSEDESDNERSYKTKQKYKDKEREYKHKDKKERKYYKKSYRDKDYDKSHRERDRDVEKSYKDKPYKHKDYRDKEKKRHNRNHSPSPSSKHHRSRSRSYSRSRSRSRSPRSRSSSRHHSRHSSPPFKRKSAYDEKRYETSFGGRAKDLSDSFAYKGQRKMMILEKLGIDLVIPENMEKPQPGTVATAPTLGQKGMITGELAAYCNLTPANSKQIMERLNRKKLLWQNKSSDPKPANEDVDVGGSSNSSAATGNPNAMWQTAVFTKDSDNKQAAKFKRLMGIKEGGAVGESSHPSAGMTDNKDLLKRQEEMFQNMEMQYEVARASTHTHRGIGLGFGIHQYPR